MKGRYKRMSLWIFSQSRFYKRSPQKRTYILPKTNQRASFCICQKGTYSLEMAVVLPLLVGYIVMFISFFQVLQIQCAVDEALLYAGRKTAVESSVIPSDELLLLSAEGFFVYALQEEALIEKCIVNGRSGVSLKASEWKDDEIILKANYSYKLPIEFFGIKEIPLSSQNRFRKWNRQLSETEEKEWVYITPTGEAYHSSISCRSLRLSIQSVPLEEIENLRGLDGQKYYECSLCNKSDEKTERVYYTSYGVLFHKDISCTFLKRTVEKIRIEEVGDRHPCKYCCE